MKGASVITLRSNIIKHSNMLVIRVQGNWFGKRNKETMVVFQIWWNLQIHADIQQAQGTQSRIEEVAICIYFFISS